MEDLMDVSANSIFTLPSSVTLRSAPDLATELRARLQPGRSLILDCGALTEADLSFAQLLIALRKSADRLGMTVSLKEAASGALQQLLIRSGFLTPPAGDPDHDDSFWLKGAQSHD
jgi:anti-anti-sigma regulatory factor